MLKRQWSIVGLLLCTMMITAIAGPHGIYLRVNQVGYLPDETKVAVAFTNQDLLKDKFEVIDARTDQTVWGPRNMGVNQGSYGNFSNHYLLDFSALKGPGRYKLKIRNRNYESLSFSINADSYNGYPEFILAYIRQQRCGYNPFLDEVCHRKDARTMYGPMPDSTYLDVSGGWHDAADFLRYLLTSGNTVCRLLFAYREQRDKFADTHNALGQPGANGIPDVLDEARWGLDWMLKMHPAPQQLFHQVADDRDHIGFKLPYQDTADYGWGPGSYRVVYYATGEPQGLGQFQNTSTGIANLAGRYAAAMAMAYDIWQNELKDLIFAERCLQAGREVYALGLKQPGCQEGTPCKAPYRYYECSWADDMEWGAAELYRATGEKSFLEQAKTFACQINTFSWMGADTTQHYEYYPFTNLGHFALFQVIDEPFQDTLIAYYRANLDSVWQKAGQNPYYIGVPFIWCSNNLVAAFITQCILYEQMSGDLRYHDLMLANRDWLLGRNPWGVSQFIEIPKTAGRTPLYPHTVMEMATGKRITGGLNDGPVYASIYRSLKGIQLTRDDPFVDFQSDLVVYHDDIGDYSTNEPTLDGTAEALFWLAYFSNDYWK